MALAYAVVLVNKQLFDQNRHDSIRTAQQEADGRLEQMAQEARLTLVTRNPEPRIMSYEGLRKMLPEGDISNLVGLYFTADIT